MKTDWVISGVGLVSAAGDKLADLHAALCAGVPLRSSTTNLNASVNGTNAVDGANAADAEDATDEAEPAFPIVPMAGFQIRDYIQRRGLNDLSRTSQLACAAASFPARDVEGVPADRVGIVLGSGWGSLRSIVDFEWETCHVAPRHVDPLLFAETVPSVPAGQISILFGWCAAALTLSSGAASGIEAIQAGIDLLEDDRAALVIVGGADEINHPVLRVLFRDKLLATDERSFPCGRGRSGLTGGEGACLLVIESRENAGARGARPLARVAATATRFAGHDGPRSGDFVSLMHELLATAQVDPGQVDLVSMAADGSASDREEATAVHEVFGEVSPPCVILPKAILGETWAASGPLAAAVAIECLRSGHVPGAPQGFVPDPDLPPLAIAPRSGPAEVRRALVLARSPGGHLAGLLIAALENRLGD